MPSWFSVLKRPLQIGLAVAVLVSAGSVFLPNYYCSEVRILPVETKGTGGLGGLAATAAAFGLNIGGGDSSDANFVDMLNSGSGRRRCGPRPCWTTSVRPISIVV